MYKRKRNPNVCPPKPKRELMLSHRGVLMVQVHLKQRVLMSTDKRPTFRANANTYSIKHKFRPHGCVTVVSSVREQKPFSGDFPHPCHTPLMKVHLNHINKRLCLGKHPWPRILILSFSTFSRRHDGSSPLHCLHHGPSNSSPCSSGGSQSVGPSENDQGRATHGNKFYTKAVVCVFVGVLVCKHMFISVK